jgi:phosphoribosylformimino-5-aminoimidazole carboxamide ribotide isomerase
MRIIIALDIMGGKCVRLTRGDFNSKKVYNEDPLEIAKEVEDNGLKYLHMVDLDGARNKRITNYRILEKISAKTGLSIDFGGGIRSDEDLRIAFNSGAAQVTGGSIAVKAPSVFLGWLVEYGPDRIILGADSRDRWVVTDGWSDQSSEDIIEFISSYASNGVKYVICTDVEKDGMLKGPSTELYREILASASVSLIASGGISSMEDLEKLQSADCEGAILGKAIYERKIKLKDLKKLC